MKNKNDRNGGKTTVMMAIMASSKLSSNGNENGQGVRDLFCLSCMLCVVRLHHVHRLHVTAMLRHRPCGCNRGNSPPLACTRKSWAAHGHVPGLKAIEPGWIRIAKRLHIARNCVGCPSNNRILVPAPTHFCICS